MKHKSFADRRFGKKRRRQSLQYFLVFTIFFSLSPFSSLWAAADPSEKYFQGLNSYEHENFKEAEKKFLDFLNEQPFEYEIRDALFYLGEIYRSRGDYENAVTYYNKLNSRFPHSRHRTNLLFLYGVCYFHLDLISRSEESFKEYLSKAGDPSQNPPFFIDANQYLAKIFEIDRSWKNAVDYYHSALLLLDPYLEQSKKNSKLFKKLKNQKREIFYALGILYSERYPVPEMAHTYLTGAVDLGQPMTPPLKFLLRRLTFMHIGKTNGLPDDAISDIVEDGDDVWIATWGGGLVRFSRSTGKYNLIPLPTTQLRNLYVDFEYVYITSFDGIFIFDKKSSRSFRLAKDEKIFGMAQKVIKDDRVIYFSTLTDGVIQYDIFKKTITTLDETSYVGSRQVYSMDANVRYIAFGTLDKGAVIKDKTTGEVITLNEENGKLGGNNVKSLLIDGRYIWIGVHKFGIYRYDLKTKNCKFFDWGLPYPSTFALRGRMLWIGTSGNGIRIYDREKQTLEKLSALEGLSSNEVHIMKMEGNYVWIGYLDNGIDILYKPVTE
ncbi:MAG: tetratricopeptide repeat protein [Spirochaetia bacterium]|nr:tetratricopeptide repeat protein [Spirochaetia bacterium]